MAPKVWDPKICRKTAKVKNFVLIQWNKWVATDIHLDQSSLHGKQWSPLRWVSRGEGEVFVELEPWWVVCLAGEVALLGLWKVIQNLMFEGLDIFNQFGYMRWLCAKRIVALCYNLVDLLLLDRRCLYLGCSGCSVLLCTFWIDCEEAEFFSMRYYLATMFRWDNSWKYLWYFVEITLKVTMTLRGRDS